MKNLTNYIIILLLLVLIIVVLQKNKQEIDFNTELAEQKIEQIPVLTQLSERKILEEEIRTAGFVKADADLMMMAQAQGRIKEVYIESGDFVKEGQLIAKVDDFYIKTQLEVVRANYDKSKKDLDRFSKLAEGDAITGQQKEGIELAYTNAKTQKELLEKQLNETRVKAPISGKVGQVFIQKGSMIGAGVPVCQLVGKEQFYLEFPFTSDRLEMLKVGQDLLILEPGMDHIKGKISAIGAKKDLMTGRYTAKAMLNGELKDELIPDMALSACIKVIDSTAFMTVPYRSIITYHGQKGVFVVENNLAKFIKVQLGKRVDNTQVIQSGLKEGEQVVVSGQHFLEDGSAVKLNQ